MCGIVGFLARQEPLRKSLGEFVVPMLTCMGERGPDSAGLAAFSAPLEDPLRRYNFFAPDRAFDWGGLLNQFSVDTDATSEIEVIENHAILISTAEPSTVTRWLEEQDLPVHLLSVGRSIDVYKDEGHPAEIARRYHFHDLH